MMCPECEIECEEEEEFESCPECGNKYILGTEEDPESYDAEDLDLD